MSQTRPSNSSLCDEHVRLREVEVYDDFRVSPPLPPLLQDVLHGVARLEPRLSHLALIPARVQFNRHFRDLLKPVPNHVWSFETCLNFEYPLVLKLYQNLSQF